MLEKDRQTFTLMPFKRIYLKLGNKCNLRCKYCHQKNINYKFNDDIIEYLSQLPNLEFLKFGGGEPLLYQDIINRILSKLDKRIQVMMVSNGTLLNQKTVDWLNNNNIGYSVSYDGDNNLRGALPQWDMIGKINNICGTSTVVTSKFSYDDFYTGLHNAMKITGKNLLLSIPNFVHQTKDNNNNELVDDVTINKYIEYICDEMKYEYQLYQQGVSIYLLPYLKVFSYDIHKNLSAKGLNGVRCCNENNIHLNAKGEFMLCSYGDVVVGDIYNGVDWNIVNSLIPNRCKECEYWNVCRNRCIANITDNDCKIFKAIYGFYNELVGDDFAR